MTNALIVGDVHLSDRAPSSRKNTYAIDIIEKIVWISDKAKELDVPLVFAGDIFHIKAPSKNSHFLVQAMHEALQGVRTFIVPGNHDLSYDRLDSLPKQPLGALARMDGVSLLIGEDDELPGIAGVPYITEFDGGSWQVRLKDYYEDFYVDSPDLLVTHAPIFPPGQAPGVYASITPEAWAEYWIGIRATYYGHIHECHGTFQDQNGYMVFCNQGALSRGSLHEATITRKPAVTLWDGSDFTRIEVPHKAPEEVFLFDEAIRKAEAKASAQEFSSLVGSVAIPKLTVEAVRASIKAQASSPKVYEIVERVLEDT